MSVLLYQDLVSKYKNDQPLDDREAAYWITRLFQHNGVSAETNILKLLTDETKNISKDRRLATPKLLSYGVANTLNKEKFDSFCRDAELDQEQGNKAVSMLTKKINSISFPDLSTNSKDIIAKLPHNISDPVERKKAELKLEASCEVACAFLKAAP